MAANRASACRMCDRGGRELRTRCMLAQIVAGKEALTLRARSRQPPIRYCHQRSPSSMQVATWGPLDRYTGPSAPARRWHRETRGHLLPCTTTIRWRRRRSRAAMRRRAAAGIRMQQGTLLTLRHAPVGLMKCDMPRRGTVMALAAMQHVGSRYYRSGSNAAYARTTDGFESKKRSVLQLGPVCARICTPAMRP